MANATPDMLTQAGVGKLWNNVTNKFEPKEAGKGLSTNDFTNEHKSSLLAMQDRIDLATDDTYIVKGNYPSELIVTTNAIVDGVRKEVNVLVSGTGVENQVGEVFNINVPFCTTYTILDEGEVTIKFISEVQGKTFPAGTNIVYTSEGWDILGGTYDFSDYVMKDDITPISDEDITSACHICTYVDNVCTVCGKKEYEDIALKADNLSMAGISTEGDVIIPSEFEYKGQKYKVTGIGNLAFDRCKSLTSVTIPEGVTSIGMGAFNGCSLLESVTIPNTVTSIKSNAFGGCKSLTSVTIPDNVTSIEDHTFAGCKSLVSINIPNTVTSIGINAFDGCTSLTSVNISNNITSIEDYTFSDCTSLASVTIPEGVTSIGNYAFDGCTSLTSVGIPSTVTDIGNYAFEDCTSLTANIPDNVKNIGGYAFRNAPHIYYNGTATGSPWGALAIN